MTEASAQRIAALAGQDLGKLVEAAKRRDFRPVPLGVTTSLELAVTPRRVETGNVLGLLRGSDPELADEVVVYTAHHDHLGVGTPDASGDRIYNGALDNSTGCAQLLALAKAFRSLPTPPKRSILLAFVAAEEQGLIGSEYFAQHPTFPAGKIAANINVDSANIYGRTRDISYVGYGKSTLDGVIERAAAAQGRVVRGDQAPEKGSFYRSDQFNFARIGVPAIYLDPGTEFLGPDAEKAKQRQQAYDSTCYHQACDEVGDDWVYDGMIEDTKLAFACGLEIANAPAMPTWKPGDEFEAARKAALAAATK
jgi:Zn-dependent M28 family amino/carboxypeptidase